MTEETPEKQKVKEQQKPEPEKQRSLLYNPFTAWLLALELQVAEEQQRKIANYVRAVEAAAPNTMATLAVLFKDTVRRIVRRRTFDDPWDAALRSGRIDRWARENYLAGPRKRLAVALLPVLRDTWNLWNLRPDFAGRYFDCEEPTTTGLDVAVEIPIPAGLWATGRVTPNLSLSELCEWYACYKQERQPPQIVALQPPKSDTDAEVWLYGWDKKVRDVDGKEKVIHVDGMARALVQLETAARATRERLEDTIGRCSAAAERARRNALMAVYFQHCKCTPDQAAKRANVTVDTPQYRRKIIEETLEDLGIEPRDRRLLHPGLYEEKGAQSL
jgi:hypothetical protein